MRAPTSDNARKLREAVHFVCKKMAHEPEKLGAVKLQKILWYFDVWSFVMTGSTFTGAVYIKKDYGPYTTAIHAIVNDLKRLGRLHTDVDDEYYGNEKAVFVGKGSTDLSVFTERERRRLEEITVDICESHSATSISEKSHGPVWRMSTLGEEIPFEAAAIKLFPASTETIELIRRDLDLAR